MFYAKVKRHSPIGTITYWREGLSISANPVLFQNLLLLSQWERGEESKEDAKLHRTHLILHADIMSYCMKLWFVGQWNSYTIKSPKGCSQ